MGMTTRSEPGSGDRGARPPISDLAVTMLASVSIALPLMFYLHQHVEMLRSGYEIEALGAQRDELLDRQRELSVREEELASAMRVEEKAAASGLEAPASTDVYLGQGGPAPTAAVAENRRRTNR